VVPKIMRREKSTTFHLLTKVIQAKMPKRRIRKDWYPI
jgi:hypothetical protein